VIEIGTAGGFGDALFTVGSILSKYSPSDVHIIHARRDSTPAIDQSLKELYESQNIESSVVHKGKGYVEWIKTNFDTNYLFEEHPHYSYMDTFPKIKFKKLDDTPSITLVPRAGGNATVKREYNIDSVNQFLKKNKPVLLLGNTDKDYVDNLKIGDHINLMNKIDVKTLINYICSSNVVIGHPGFCVYLAAMTGKKVYTTIEPACSHLYFNPKWNVDFITNL
jgi:hypothetical protein